MALVSFNLECLYCQGSGFRANSVTNRSDEGKLCPLYITLDCLSCGKQSVAHPDFEKRRDST